MQTKNEITVKYTQTRKENHSNPYQHLEPT